MKPLITVIIDTYNYGNFIENSIESVLAQNFPKEQVEIIIVDDGSTDDTEERIKKYKEKIKYIYQENKGQAEAFNTGFAHSQGEVICLLDADDYWYPEKLKTVIEKFERCPDVGMVQHFMQEVDTEGRIVKKNYPRWKEFYSKEDILSGEINFRSTFTGTSGLSFKRKFLENIIPVPIGFTFCADQYLYLVILYSKVSSINKILGRKRIHGENWFASKFYNMDRYRKYMETQNLFDVILTEKMRKLGLSYSPRLRTCLRSEQLAEEIIALALSKRKSLGIRKSVNFLVGNKLTLYSLFKFLTFVTAILSPALYLRLYETYSRMPMLPRLRQLIFRK